ncbi:MAG: ATP-binding cassette domain-containing protein [Candidatus Nanohaloarchaea archaeon]|nr:ATP-binding cassette domain-containing protein [Candidatus Nanohaloarchaea archaeon]
MSGTGGDAIQVDGLTKFYGSDPAVDTISFTVRQGEIFGILGPNGAGKTTTVNMMATLLAPTQGSATVNGFDIQEEPGGVRDSIGMVFQEAALDDWLTGRDNMEFHADMYDLEDKEERIREMLELVDLQEDADKKVEDYSGGMKRRLELARGLLHRPEILFLDEPTLGLDAETRRRIWDYIEHLNRDEGMTIILTTHYMEEADTLCDRTAILQEGRIRALDTPANLKQQIGGDIIRVELDQYVDGLIDDLDGCEWVEKAENDDAIVSITATDAERHITSLIDVIGSAGADIESINMRKPSLEDVFLHVTGSTFDENTVLDGDTT